MLLDDSLLLAEEPSGDVSHVRLLELVVFAVVPIDSDKVEGFNDGVNVKSHVDEAVYKVLIPALIPVSTMSDHWHAR
jgi:hypothetical protein